MAFIRTPFEEIDYDYSLRTRSEKMDITLLMIQHIKPSPKKPMPQTKKPNNVEFIP